MHEFAMYKISNLCNIQVQGRLIQEISGLSLVRIFRISLMLRCSAIYEANLTVEISCIQLLRDAFHVTRINGPPIHACHSSWLPDLRARMICELPGCPINASSMTKSSRVKVNTVRPLVLNCLSAAAAIRHTSKLIQLNSPGTPKCVNDGANLFMLATTSVLCGTSRKPVRTRRRNDGAEWMQSNASPSKYPSAKGCWIESSARAGRDGGKGN